MEAKDIDELKLFIDRCKQNPSVLHHPSIAFFNRFLQSFGAKIPQSGESSGKGGVDHPSEKNFVPESRDEEMLEDIVESDIELDNADILEPDNDPPVKMGDPSTEVTEETQEAAQLSKSKAMDAISEGNMNEAIDLLTEAIVLNPKSAIFYANRAGVFIKMKKPNAAIRDADAALQINPDSAKGYKARGTAKAMLGLWEEAARDLHVASNLDFDEEIGLLLKKVEPNVKKIGDHRRKYERLRKERELRKIEIEQLRRKAKAQAEAAAMFKEGEIQGIHSASDLKNKLDAASKASRIAILYFTATWCGPCRHMSPFYTTLAGKYKKGVFLKVDIDEAGDAAAEWNISSVPTFIIVKDGKEIDKFIGVDKNALENRIEKHVG